jgi:hypothetical protein
VNAAMASILNVAAAAVELQSVVTVAPRYAPLFEVDVDFPAEWTLLEARAADDQVLAWRVTPQEPGWNRARIPLLSPLADGASTFVKLMFRRDVEGWPVEANPVLFALPELVLPQATLVETALVVIGDRDLDLAVEGVTGLDPIPLKETWERLRYQSQETRYSAQMKVSRKRAETAVETLAFYRLDRQSLSATLFASLELSGGGAGGR